MLRVISADVRGGWRPSGPVHRRCCSKAISLGSLLRPRQRIPAGVSALADG
jgi:hypothetical protein